MSQVHLACGLPFCQNPKDIQTNLSIGLRITAVVLGTLAVIVGTLILLNIPGLSHLGTTVGWTLVSIGTFLVLVGVSIKCVKRKSVITTENEPQFRSNESQTLKTEKNAVDDKPPQERRKENTLESNKSTTISTTKKERKEVKLNSTQTQILDDFTPQMVEALGGVDQYLALPKIKNWGGSIDLEHMKAPVMRGYHEKGRPFLLFCYFRYSVDTGKYEVAGEYLGRRKDGSWESAYAHPSELNLRSPNPILDNTLAAQHMLNKVTRLMSGEAMGAVERFPGIILSKPSDKGTWRPINAYLENETIEQFMDLDTLFYERKPKEGTSELFLYNPRISREENVKLYRQKFPKD